MRNKIVLRSIVACLIFGGILLCGYTSAGEFDNENLFSNSGFEDGAVEWWEYNPSKNNAEFRIDKDKHNGEKSGCLEGKTKEYHGGWVQNITLMPDTTYKYSSWIKLYLKGPESRAQCLYGGGTVTDKGEKKWWGHGCARDITKTTDWTYLEVEFTTPYWNSPQTVGFQPALLHNEGIVWIDDVSLVELKPSAAEKKMPLKYQFHPAHYGRDDKIYLLDNSPNAVYLCLRQSQALKNASLVLDLPEDISLKGVFNSGYDSSPVNVSKKEIVKENKKYIRHYVHLSPYISSPNASNAYYEYILLLNSENRKGEKTWIYSHLICDGIETKERKTETFILPELKVRRKPKHFKIWVHRDYPFYFGYDNSVWKNKELWHVLVGTYKKAGISTVVGDAPEIIERLQQEGLDYIHFIGGFETFYSYKGNGKPHCLTRLIHKEEPDFSQIAAWATSGVSKGADGVLYNSEPGPTHFCYCQKCLEAFSKHAGIALKGLNKNIILSKYKKEWVRFKAHQSAEVIRLVGEEIKRVNPKATYVMCTGMGIDCSAVDETNFLWRWGGMDPRVFEKYVDYYSPMLYVDSKTVYKTIERTANALEKPEKMLPYIDVNFGAGPPGFSPPQDIRLDMFSAATSGLGGVALYLISGLDGEYMQTVEKTAYEIALLEDWFLNGKRDDSLMQVKGLPYSEYYLEVKGKKIPVEEPLWEGNLCHKVHLWQGNHLLSLFNLNLDKQDAYVRISATAMRKSKYMLYDPISETIVVPSSNRKYWKPEELKAGITYFVPRNEVKFLVMVPYDEKVGFKKTVLETEIRQDYKKRKVQRSQKQRGEITEGSLKIGWIDGDKNGKYEPTLESKLQKLWIKSEKGGKLWSWKIKEASEDLVLSNFVAYDVGGAFADQFYQKPCPWNELYLRDKRYEVTSRGIRKGEAIVKLSQNIEDKLVLAKTYSIPSNKPEIKINYTIKNISKQSLDISFWLHNFFKLGEETLKKKGISVKDGINLIFPTKGGIKAVDAKDGSIVYAVENAPYNPGRKEWEKKSRKGELTEGWFGLYCPLSKEALIIKVDYAQLLQVYRWQGAGAFTLEWMYKTERIEPGEIWQTEIRLFYLKEANPDVIENWVKGRGKINRVLKQEGQT